MNERTHRSRPLAWHTNSHELRLTSDAHDLFQENNQLLYINASCREQPHLDAGSTTPFPPAECFCMERIRTARSVLPIIADIIAPYEKRYRAIR